MKIARSILAIAMALVTLPSLAVPHDQLSREIFKVVYDKYVKPNESISEYIIKPLCGNGGDGIISVIDEESYCIELIEEAYFSITLPDMKQSSIVKTSHWVMDDNAIKVNGFPQKAFPDSQRYTTGKLPNSVIVIDITTSKSNLNKVESSILTDNQREVFDTYFEVLSIYSKPVSVPKPTSGKDKWWEVFLDGQKVSLKIYDKSHYQFPHGVYTIKHILIDGKANVVDDFASKAFADETWLRTPQYPNSIFLLSAHQPQARRATTNDGTVREVGVNQVKNRSALIFNPTNEGCVIEKRDGEEVAVESFNSSFMIPSHAAISLKCFE